jgi:hypothetical protein
MVGRVYAGKSPGDIQKVIASKQLPTGKGRSNKVNEASKAPDTFSLGDTTYYLNKGETITFQGCLFQPMPPWYTTVLDSMTMDKVLVDSGANGGSCGKDMLVVEGSEPFVDLSGLAGHQENCDDSGCHQHTGRSSHFYLISNGVIK